MSVENLAGQTLGSYELRDLLGAGGMGAVYRAVQTSLKREVALKVLPALLAQRGSYIERFIHEAKIAASLEHPNIVPIYDYGTQRDISYVVMRLLSGGSLAERLQRASDTGSLPSIGEVADLLRQLASALDYAHSRGVIHRDIKASNVMFDSYGTAYLVDFGIAKLIDATSGLTGTGQTLGTPSYMPPEQWRDEVLTPAADQYALAVLVYAMVTGRLPFEASTPFALMHKHLNELPTPPQLIRSELSADVTIVLERALAKGAADRFPTVTAFAQAFNSATEGVKGDATGFFLVRPTPPPNFPVLSTQRDFTSPPAHPPTHTPTPLEGTATSLGIPMPTPTPLPTGGTGTPMPMSPPTPAPIVPAPRGGRSLLLPIMVVIALVLAGVLAFLLMPRPDAGAATPSATAAIALISTITDTPPPDSTAVSQAAETDAPTADVIAVVMATDESTAEVVNTAVPPATATNVPTETERATATVSSTEAPNVVPTENATETDVPATSTPRPTNTIRPTATDIPATNTPRPTNTERPTATDVPATGTPTATATTTPTETHTPTPDPTTAFVTDVRLEFDREVEGTGWEAPEIMEGGETAIWTLTTASTLPLRLEPGHDYTIRFAVLWDVDGSIIDSLALRVNESLIPLQRTDAPTRGYIYEGVIPAADVGDSETVLTFEIAGLVSPLSVGKTDARNLGVMFDWLEIEIATPTDILPTTAAPDTEVRLDFNSAFPGTGWSQPEIMENGETVMWSTSTASTIRLRLEPGHYYAVRFAVLWDVDDGSVLDTLALRVNGNLVPLIRTNAEVGYMYEGVIPQEDVGESQTVLVFEIDRLVNPVTVGQGGASRNLGVMFDWLEVTHATDEQIQALADAQPTDTPQPLTSASDTPAPSTDDTRILAYGDQRTGEVADAQGEKWVFSGTAGDVVMISLSSPTFDTYLTLLDAQGNILMEDDDSGGSTNSFLLPSLPETGNYVIEATGYEEQTGKYNLFIDLAPAFEGPYSSASARDVINTLADEGIIPGADGAISVSLSGFILELTDFDNTYYGYTLHEDLGNFVMATTIHWGPGSPADQCGFMFRTGENQVYLMQIDRNQTVEFAKNENEEWLADYGTGDAILTGADDANQLMVVAVGRTFVVYINGQKAGLFQDDSFARGGLGLVGTTYEDADEARCVFTDTWVWSLP